MTEQKMIEQRIKPYVGYRNYKVVDFSAIWYGYNNSDNDSFFSRNGITFEDYVGSQYLTGSDLLYYPELAGAMREIKEYPVLKRTYKVDENIQGMSFIEYFYELIKQSFNSFMAELTLASSQVDHLIHKYGMKRKAPIVNRIEVDQVNSCQRRKLIINGIPWQLKQDRNQELKITESFDLKSALNISPDIHKVLLEDAVIGTSFIAVRIAKTWQHKGHVNWYDLNTLKKVSRADMVKAK